MDSGNRIIDTLNSLEAQLLAMDASDKQAVVTLGTAMESLCQGLSKGQEGEMAVLTASLETLQAVYADAVANAASSLEALAESLAAMARCLKTGKADTQQQELHTIASTLRGQLTAPSAPAAPATPVVRTAEAAVPSPVVVEDEPAPVEENPPRQNEPAEPISPEAVSAPTVASTPPPEPTSVAAPAVAAPAVAAPAAPAEVTGTRLPTDTDLGLLNEYIAESLDHITAAETAMLALETNPEDTETINTIFRAFHTIKGTSGFLGLETIQRLAHRAENLLDRARNHEIRITGGYADLSLKSCDLLRSMIEDLRTAQPGDMLEVPSALPGLIETLSDPESAGIGEEIDSAPMRLGEILVGKNKVEREDVEQAAAEQGPRPIGEVLVETGTARAADVVDALRVQKKQTDAPAATADASVRVNVQRLDSLINMVGELVIAQSMVAQDLSVTSGTNVRLSRNVGHAGKIVKELQDLSMSLRMVPLKGLFQKMARLARDVSRKSGKNIRFVTEGEETEIDRNMVETLGDPLVHMVRNAVDHGIESAEQRAASGKDPVGTVTLKAYHSAGSVVLELRDDGKGLDREKILTKAVQKGLVEAGHELSDSETFNLIFLPGFSTAEKVTDVSGRGVGMDVVKKGIESMRGRVDITSRSGEGSTFTIRLPLTMAITDAMLLRVGQQRYLLPTISIEHTFRPQAKDIITVTQRGEMVMIRGEPIAVFRLHKLFGVQDAVTDPPQGLLIVVSGGGHRAALMADELLGQQQVVVKSLGTSMGTIPGVAGGAILGDGRIGLVLDATGIVSLALNCQEAAGAAA